MRDMVAQGKVDMERTVTSDVEEQVLRPPAEQSARDGRRESERRRGRSRFHLPERRTGFDRRRRYPVTGTLRDNPSLLLGVLVMINTLSALDFALTYLQLQAGVAWEGNPLLAGLFARGPGQAWLFKSGVMLAISFVIWHQRKHRAMLTVALATLALYSLLIVYHVLGMQVSGLI